MNLPNLITVFRIVLIPFFLNFLVYGYTDLALIVFLVAGLTDALDGAIARMTKTKSEIGAALDPLADKMLALAAFVALTILGKIPLWLTLTVVTRDVIVVTGSVILYIQGYDLKIRPTIAGKMATFFQLLLLAVALLSVYMKRDFAAIDYLVWVALALTVASGAQYVIRGFALAGAGEQRAK